MITLSKEYQIALDVIDYLKQDEELAPFVFDEIYEHDSQAGRIEAAAKKSSGCILVWITPSQAVYDDKGEISFHLMSAQVYVSSLMTPNISKEDTGLTASQFISALTERAIRAIKKMPSVNPRTYARNRHSGAVETFFDEKTKLKNFIAQTFKLEIEYQLNS